jgi:hypothetical protein
VCAVPRVAHGLDVKIWPLFRYSTGAGDDLRWTALGPLVEFVRTAETRDLYVRPLIWLHQRRGAARDDRADILYPLAASRWQDRYQTFRFLLFSYRSSAPAGGPTPPPAAWTTRYTLFPFAFYRAAPTSGTHVGVLPFYLDLRDFFGYERVQAVLFPAYLRLREPRVDTRFYGFPFVSTVGGPDGRGLRLWPFWGYKDIAGREHTRYVLWPFYLRSARLVPGHGWDDVRMSFPFFAARDGAGLHTRAYGIVVRTHTVNERAGYEAIGAPWPFVFKKRPLGETTWSTWRLAPFYGRIDEHGFSSRFYAWPGYRWRALDRDDYHFERRDALLLLWRREDEHNDASGREVHLWTLFPALRSRTFAGRHVGQAPALVDSLTPVNRGVLGLWAPLWGIVRWDTEPDGRRDWNLLWGLVAREHGRLLGPWHVARGPAWGATAGH